MDKVSGNIENYINTEVRIYCYILNALIITFVTKLTMSSNLFGSPTGPTQTHILLMGGPKDFFGSEILTKRDFLGSMKDVGIFLGREKTGIFLGIVLFFSSNQQ